MLEILYYNDGTRYDVVQYLMLGITTIINKMLYTLSTFVQRDGINETTGWPEQNIVFFFNKLERRSTAANNSEFSRGFEMCVAKRICENYSSSCPFTAYTVLKKLAVQARRIRFDSLAACFLFFIYTRARARACVCVLILNILHWRFDPPTITI